MTTGYYYLSDDNLVCGPDPLTDIVEKIKLGTLRDSTQLCAEGTEEWLPLAEFLPKANPAGADVPIIQDEKRLNKMAECGKRLAHMVGPAAWGIIAFSLLCLPALLFSPLLFLFISGLLLGGGALVLRSFKSVHSSPQRLKVAMAAIGAGGSMLCLLLISTLGISLSGMRTKTPAEDYSGNRSQYKDLSQEEFNRIYQESEAFWRNQARNTPPIEGASPFSIDHPGIYVPPQFREAKRRAEEAAR